MRILAHIFSIFAFSLSSLLTVQLLISRAQGLAATTMMALLGLVAEGGKGLLFYHGLQEAKLKRLLSALPALATSAFLIFLSILGTVSALNLTENQFRAQEAQASLQSQAAHRMIARAAELRKEADELPDIYRTGKIRRRNEAWELEQKAQEILKTEQGRTADQFERIAAFLGISANSAQMLVYWGYGFALEAIACLLAIMAIWTAGAPKKNQAPKTDIPESAKTTTSKQTPTQQDKAQGLTQAQKELLHTYIDQAHLGDRMKGFNKTTLSRSEWENCVKILYKAGLLKKNNVGLAPTKNKEEMLLWVGLNG